MIRAIFAVLAVADALLFSYLLVNYGWFSAYAVPITESIASMVIVPLLWALTLLDRVFALAFFAAIATGIWKDLSGRERPRWLAVVTTPVLMLAFAAVAFIWIAVVREVASQPAGMVHDRLTLFDALARQARVGDLEMLGLVNYATGSIGHALIVLLGVLYLAEKHLVQSWRVRWPVPLAPIIAVAWVVTMVVMGERHQRDYVAAQQWRAAGPHLSWLEALEHCEQLGPGWRLPRREELARYLATRPPEVQTWEGAAWTSRIENNAEWAVGVDLTPRQSGRWNKASEPTRDESLCESRQLSGYATDWFAALRREVCDRTTTSPYLFTPGLHPAALASGAAVTQPAGAAVCIRPAGETTFPHYYWRGYEGRDFDSVAAFRDTIAEYCRTSPLGGGAGCFAHAPDLPPFAETGDEQVMRAFCSVAANGEACARYAAMMDQRPDAADRAARYRELACRRGVKTACSQPPR